MAINHADHDHPATPAARAACRKEMGSAPARRIVRPDGSIVPDKPARKPRGIDAGYGRTVYIRDEGDLANEVPHMFTSAIRHAWEKEWEVRQGIPYNEIEKRILITSVHGELALAYRAGQSGVNGVFWRPAGTSITRRLQTGPVIANGIVKLERGDRVEDPE